MTTETQLMWLLARLYMVNRRNYVTSYLEPLQNELTAFLTTIAGDLVDEMTDGAIETIFQPKAVKVATKPRKVNEE